MRSRSSTLRNGVGDHLVGKEELADDIFITRGFKADDDAVTNNVKSFAECRHSDGLDVIGGVEIVQRYLLARERNGGTVIAVAVIKIQLGAADAPGA